MSAPSLVRWSEHLRAVAAPATGDIALGGAGSLAEPFGRAVCGIRGTPPAPPDDAAPDEVALWWAVLDERIDVGGVLGSSPVGPLFGLDRYRALEVWTEAELCGLHALWRLARVRDRDDLRRRAAAARDHHVLHTQPDNATNRPWALHVFLLGGTPESTHYAETLLHNAMAASGTPDPFSAWILMDAAAELDRVEGRS